MYCVDIYNIIYICTYIYIYSTKSNERGWLYRYVCWQLSFYGWAAAESVGDGCCLCPASHLNKRLACIGLHSDVDIYMYIYIYDMYVYTWLCCMCIYIYTTIYIYNYVLYIYLHLYIYSTKCNERGWLYRYVCWQLSFYGWAAAECVGDGCCLCPASHLNKRLACIGLHSDVYLYICVYIYNVYVYTWLCIEIFIYIYVHNYVYIQLSIGCGMCWRTSNGQGKKKQRMDGPGRIRARNHLLPRLLQNAPGA